MFPTTNRYPIVRIALGILCGSTIIGLSGCGGGGGLQRSSVAGKVTVDGQPLDEGIISFIPTDKTTGPSSGGKIAGGAYAIDDSHGLVVGTYRVEIRAARKTGKKVEAGLPAKPGTMVEETVPFLPSKYNSESVLTADIKSGKNVLDFALNANP